MGVPKFYRWISERYPNMSRVVNDNQIPEFDNFYLDMNGIIHTCSHINEDNCEIHVTEEEIFRNIFHYLDFLFRMIKPKKVFFMAIDGVAPRAKMNQQRARRFRAGKDRTRKLEILAKKTEQSFEQIASKHFDTNAITPGTQFMANLDEQLRYFIHVKLTTDPLWENVDVHLSGHLTPGEGEHKIMEYIRYIRSQPGYNINTRHCLYGLDADLIMLGLVTHEMHFALLREEVKYGSKKVSKILTPEEINWHLLHICLLRDYIDLEFRPIRDKIQFPYNLDRIIDDWILMGYLVGNDFIPHLPRIHINEEALSILWNTYKQVLPKLDGYMNNSGELNLVRFETYITELAKYDRQRFVEENDSFKHLAKLNSNRSKTKSQSDSSGFDLAVLDKLNEPAPITTNDQLDRLNSIEEKPLEIISISDDNDYLTDSSTISNESDDEDDIEEGKKSSTIISQDDLDRLPLIDAEFRQHKNHYYRDKMKIDFPTVDQLQIYINQYIEALQWILKYYYQGCPSWSWFYPHHYAPYLSDLKNFKDLKINFEKGTPFKPFEQLLSVLPPTSRQLLPEILQSLMTNPTSPLLSFYPEDFELDQNEKKKDWEAIVLLPFIDEKLLLNTITPYYNQLNSIDANRNRHTLSSCFRTTNHLQPIENALKFNSYFPTLNETRATCHEVTMGDIQIKYGRFDEKHMLIFPKFPILNALPYKYDYKTSAVSLFESRSRATTLVLNLNHRPDSDCITYNNQWNPKDTNPSSSPFQISNIRLLIERYLGKCVFVNWPHFQQGIVCAISDFQNFYYWLNIPGGSNFHPEPINPDENRSFRNYSQRPIHVSDYPFEVSFQNHSNKKPKYYTIPFNETDRHMEYNKALTINRQYENQQGVSIGPIPILLYVSPLIGYRTKCSTNSNECQTSMCFSNQALAYPLQTTLFKLPKYQDISKQIPRTIDEYFKRNDPIFALENPYYSSLGFVEQINRNDQGKYRISCKMDIFQQADIHQQAPKLEEYRLKYFTAQEIADQIKTIPCVVSKLTGKINVFSRTNQRRRAVSMNIGLSWKMNKPVKQLHGYTRKEGEVWLYSKAAIPIITEYMTKFPEVIAELERKPRDDNYQESNIWPDKNGKHELQQIRIWMKSLPTYSIQLTDSAWNILDAPIINEIDKSVQSFNEKQSMRKTKTISFEPSHLFKPNELLGMCDPDIRTTFELYDRVVNVRLDTGVPIGTLGTIVGIMRNRLNLDTYYEILFDNLSATSLQSILHRKKQEKCRIVVHSYHLLNYSHSLRIRSTNYHSQRSNPSEQINKYEQPPRFTTKQTNKTDNNTTKTPKSAPPLIRNDQQFFSRNNQPIWQANTVTQERVFPSHEQQHSIIMQPQFSNQLSFQPMMQPIYPLNNQVPGNLIRPLNTSMPVNNEQQQQLQTVPTGILSEPTERSKQLAANSTLSYDAPPFQPRQIPTRPPYN